MFYSRAWTVHFFLSLTPSDGQQRMLTVLNRLEKNKKSLQYYSHRFDWHFSLRNKCTFSLLASHQCVGTGGLQSRLPACRPTWLCASLSASVVRLAEASRNPEPDLHIKYLTFLWGPRSGSGSPDCHLLTVAPEPVSGRRFGSQGGRTRGFDGFIAHSWLRHQQSCTSSSSAKVSNDSRNFVKDSSDFSTNQIQPSQDSTAISFLLSPAIHLVHVVDLPSRASGLRASLCYTSNTVLRAEAQWGS